MMSSIVALPFKLPTYTISLIVIKTRHASHTSSSWMERQKKDIYVKMSRYHNYRARSAFKLIQMDDQHHLLKPNMIVIDAGAAPGSWTQVVCERLKLKDPKYNKKGMCLAVDLSAIEPIEGAICLGNADFTSAFTQAKILTWLDGKLADCVLSDMAPKASGQKYLDHERNVSLVNSLLPFVRSVLKPGTGTFLYKLWDGASSDELSEQMKQDFEHVVRLKPEASRDDSAETYWLCRGLKGSDVKASDSVVK